MTKPDQALQAKLSKLSPAQREALLKKLQEKKSRKTPSLSDMPISAQPRDSEDYPLSFAQQRLWFLEQLNPGQATYNIAAALQLSGNLQVALLNQTFKRIIQRHESLRTVFINTASGARQKVLPRMDWELDFEDLSGDSADDDLWIGDEANTGFDLENGPLIRAKLVKLSDSEHTLTVVMHHIISDAWSSQILLNEVSRFYTALHQGTAIAMPAPAIQYIDYSLWQQQHLTQNENELAQKQLDYWREQLEGCENLQLASDKGRPNQLSYQGAIVRQHIDSATVKQLQTLCQKQGSTVFIALMALFQTLLYRHSDQQDFCIGTPVAGRNHGDLEPLIGFFVNSLTIRNNASGAKSFTNLLQQVKQTVLAAQSHQDIPFEQLVNALSPERDGSYSPLFQVFFSYTPGTAEAQLSLPAVQARFITADTDTAKFDVSLIISDKMVNDELQLACQFEYNTDLFSELQIQRLAQHFIHLVHQACENPEAALHSLKMLTTEEQHNLAALAPNTNTQQSNNVAQLIVEQAQSTPEKTAIVQGSRSLSFGELDRQSNQLAHYLLSQGIHNGDFIGLCFPPSIDLMVALVACVKLGACYVPMDPAYPTDRLSYMAEHAELKALLTASRIDTSAIEVQGQINIDKLELATFDDSPLQTTIDAQQALYVIYTSGSTGLPKAAMVSHANEVNLLQWYGAEFNCSAEDRLLVFSAIGFDLTQKNLLLPLTHGAQLHFSEQEYYDPELLLQSIAESNISWINCAPSAFYPLIDGCTDFAQLQSLNKLFFGGEPIQQQLLSQWMHSNYCHAQICNMYGPTECTDIATSYILDKSVDNRVIPIGRPAANVQLYILDGDHNQLPAGAIGELYIGGAGVGLGYLNNTQITQERFIDNPFSSVAEKLYRTGDLVRLRECGNIEFIARCDEQIKVRGFRVELGEIESQLRDMQGIDDAVVCTRSISGQSQLLAFVQSAEALQEQHYYKQQLGQHLPDYMVPIAYFPIDDIPLSANGKIARNRLPEVDLSQLKQAEYIAPRNVDEAELASVWQHLLGIDKIGIRDNFFELGGHSLLATQMLTRIRDSFDVELPLRTIFEVSTIEGLAEIIAAMKPADMDDDEGSLLEDDEDFEEGIL